MRRFRGLLQHMTRSYEAADKSRLEQRSDFAIVLAFQKISALCKLNLLLFWGLFCSVHCIPALKTAHLPQHWFMYAFTSISTASKCLLQQAGGGCLYFKPKSQGLHQQPHSFQPRTSLEDKASAYRSSLLSGLISQAHLTSAVSVRRHPAERRRKALEQN